MFNIDTQMIYIVDDDAAVRESLEALLATTGVETRAFSSPRGFLDATAAQNAAFESACLLLDLDLGDPEMDGLDMISALREAGRDVPFILISGRLTPRDADRARKAGAAAVLTKPVVYSVLVEAILSAVSRAA